MGLGHRARHVPYDVPTDVADVRRSLKKFQAPMPRAVRFVACAAHRSSGTLLFKSSHYVLTCETIENFVQKRKVAFSLCSLGG